MIKLITEYKDYLLLVDTEKTINHQQGTYVVSSVNGSIKRNGIADYNGEEIIAASPKLGDLPLLPELPKQEEGFGEDLWETYRKPLNRNMSHLERETFIAGYKAASNKWSDEDIKKALYEDLPQFDGNRKRYISFNELMQKLQSPKLTPIGFEPEMDWKDTLLPYKDLSIRQYRIVKGVLQGTYKF